MIMIRAAAGSEAAAYGICQRPLRPGGAGLVSESARARPAPWPWLRGGPRAAIAAATRDGPGLSDHFNFLELSLVIVFKFFYISK